MWTEQWRTLLCVYTWLSSAAGDLGSSCSRTMGTALIEVARAGKVRMGEEKNKLVECDGWKNGSGDSHKD
jgi:hypothetical protein